jgi:DNA (cytosine-5)-methyltransferase 1
LSVISLYTGAGGLDIGLEAAGLRPAIAVELDAKACDTLRENHGRRLPVYEGDIHCLTSDSICETTGLAPEEPDLLVGGPPCQPFSKSAYWRSGDTKRLDDPRADTLSAYLRVLRDLKPRAFLIENVHGLMFRGKDEGLRLLRDTINAINVATGTDYSFQVAKLNAADYGVPQTRERVFIVGSRDGKVFKFPIPTHRGPVDRTIPEQADRDAREVWRTAWDAIGDLNYLEDPNLRVGGRWGDLLPSIPDGENFWGFLLKLAKDRPAWTVQAQPGTAIGPFHWRSRRLSTRELCRIQTFPDTYEIIGGRSDVQRQLGNAVPSLLAEILGRAIRHQLLGHTVRGNVLKLAVPSRGKPPKPEALKKVPLRYHAQIGEHSAHPGTGRGYAFAAR